MARQEFWLRPSSTVNQIVGYSYGYAQEEYGVLIHQLTVMSNHIHITVTDPTGDRLSTFFSSAHSMIARCLNAHYAVKENRWKIGSFTPVHVGDEEAVLDKIVYSMINPVKAGLVSKAENWPGWDTTEANFDKPKTCHRPGVFFRDGMPETVKLAVTVPPMFESTKAEFADRVRKRRRHLQTEKRRAFKASGMIFLGAKRVSKMNPWTRPKAASVPVEGSKLNPRIACKNAERRKTIIAELRGFYDAYESARRRLLDGERDVEFPAGTVWLRLYANVVCQPP
jgi:REP element-mobilizing transposase RayT